MLISNISADDDIQSFETPRKQLQCHCTKGPYFFSYNDYQSFETPRINNRSETAPNSQILLGDDNA